jgi:hypothetical protein
LLEMGPRTLAFVFGDHGFWTDPNFGSDVPLRHGGSSPEEVLVPAFAWLIETPVTPHPSANRESRGPATRDSRRPARDNGK